jgi:hypothetical protein
MLIKPIPRSFASGVIQNRLSNEANPARTLPS